MSASDLEQRQLLGSGDFLGSDQISSFRRRLDELFLGGLHRLSIGVATHWLAIFNLWVGAFAILPVLAPMLLAAGWPAPANLIYSAYSYACHQLPERSFFLFGHKMAYCQRDTAIYLTILAGGLAYARIRHRARALDWRLYCLAVLPMVVDGTTQLFGWRESTWQLRVITGLLFGAATVWLAYPLFEKTMRELRLEMESSAPPPGGESECLLVDPAIYVSHVTH